MRYGSLGSTGIRVSRLGLGTAALGGPYGVMASAYEACDPQKSAAVLGAAVDAGVTYFDTAPTYGDAEMLLGDVVPPTSVIATKVVYASRDALIRDLDLSLRRLRRTFVDVLQVHNATTDIWQDAFIEALLELRDQGYCRVIGATVYDVSEARAAINAGLEVIQVPYSLLDQRFAPIFDEAVRAGVTVVLRSVLLQGLLSARGAATDKRASIQSAVDTLGCGWAGLRGLALRFALSAAPNAVASVVVGPRTITELHAAIMSEREGALSVNTLRLASTVACTDLDVVDPRRWGKQINGVEEIH